MKDCQLRTKKFYNIGPLKIRDSKYYFLSLGVSGRRYRTLDIRIMSQLLYHCATTSGHCEYEVNNILIFWRNDTWHNDILHNDIQLKGLICDTHHK